MVKIAIGSIGDSFSATSLKSYLSEFIATLLFVFAGVGSAIAYGKLTVDAALDPAGLVAIAIAHALALFVGVSMAANISGGHLNPAVTLGLAIGGNITILTGIFYWIAQLLGSTVACFLLKFVTGGKVSYPTYNFSNYMAVTGSLLPSSSNNQTPLPSATTPLPPLVSYINTDDFFVDPFDWASYDVQASYQFFSEHPPLPITAGCSLSVTAQQPNIANATAEDSSAPSLSVDNWPSSSRIGEDPFLSDSALTLISDGEFKVKNLLATSEQKFST